MLDSDNIRQVLIVPENVLLISAKILIIPCKVLIKRKDLKQNWPAMKKKQREKTQ